VRNVTIADILSVAVRMKRLILLTLIGRGSVRFPFRKCQKSSSSLLESEALSAPSAEYDMCDG
jgi:hypothetical protein